MMTVSSGLAFVRWLRRRPIARPRQRSTPTRSRCGISLKDTTTEVVELIPPYVATELMGSSAGDPRAMPLDKFIAE